MNINNENIRRKWDSLLNCCVNILNNLLSSKKKKKHQVEQQIKHVRSSCVEKSMIMISFDDRILDNKYIDKFFVCISISYVYYICTLFH